MLKFITSKPVFVTYDLNTFLLILNVLLLLFTG